MFDSDAAAPEMGRAANARVGATAARGENGANRAPLRRAERPPIGEALDELAFRLRDADAILVGIGSGLSSAAGYDHYHWRGALAAELFEFREHYGFASPFAGFYHCYSTPAQQWACYARYIAGMADAPTGRPYLELRALLEGRDFFILTSNVDGQCARVFPADRLCRYQGDMAYLQCSQPCHDRVYPALEIIRALDGARRGVELPPELLPRCPDCGRIMVPWVRDDGFLEGEMWRGELERYRAFLRRLLMREKPAKLLLLELGVGEMTPAVIQLPFWQLAARNPSAFYARLNRDETSPPEHLRGRSLHVRGDLADTMGALLARVQQRSKGETPS